MEGEQRSALIYIIQERERKKKSRFKEEIIKETRYLWRKVRTSNLTGTFLLYFLFVTLRQCPSNIKKKYKKTRRKHNKEGVRRDEIVAEIEKVKKDRRRTGWQVISEP